MLSRINRLTQKRDFDAVYLRGRAFLENKLSLTTLLRSENEQSRFGFVVSLKVSRKAVVRNRIKRIMRSVVERELPSLRRGFDCVFIFRGGEDFLPGDLRDDMGKVIRKAGILK